MAEGIVTNGYMGDVRVISIETDPLIIYRRTQIVMEKHYVGEEKTVVVDTGVDISAATTTIIMVKKPDDTVVEWAAEVYIIEGVSSYLKYVLLSTDLNIPGLFEIQSKVIIGGKTLYGDTARFEVMEIFT
jgi:hypothetical protein